MAHEYEYCTHAMENPSQQPKSETNASMDNAPAQLSGTIIFPGTASNVNSHTRIYRAGMSAAQL